MIFDLIIVGADSAGLTAGIYAGRKKMNAVILSKQIGGQSLYAARIENYPGIQSVSGTNLVSAIKKQVERHGIAIKDDTEIGEPAEENPAKYKYAREHFERINTNLKKSDEKMYYQFNFLTPIDYTVFFQNMRQGEIKDFQSNLDIRLMEKL